MFSRKEINPVNQTEFVEEAQLLDKQSLGLFNLKNLKKNKHLLPFVVLIFLFLVIILLMILKVALKQDSVLTEINETTKEDVKLDPLNLRVNELKETLKDHNPTKESLPFPQVDLEFNIN